MGIMELVGLSFALAMDAFAVSICKGMAIKEYRFKNSLIIGSYFGSFQALMPLLGYFLGSFLYNYIAFLDHWIAFVLLVLIGINMIKESRESESCDLALDMKSMLILAIATSIDAFAVGLTLAFLDIDLFFAVSCIGIITFALSAFGVKIGNKFGSLLNSKAEVFGGLILIGIGFKVLVEHLFNL